VTDAAAHLAGARAAVLARLWGALAREPLPREPLPGLTDRTRTGGTLRVTVNGHTIDGPTGAAEPFARLDSLTLHVDGVPTDDPAALIDAIRPARPSVPSRDHRDGDTTSLSGPGVPVGPSRTERRGDTASRSRGGGAIGDVYDRFADELAGSVHGVALARAAAQPEPRALRDLAGDPHALAVLEQSIVDGHRCTRSAGRAPASATTRSAPTPPSTTPSSTSKSTTSRPTAGTPPAAACRRACSSIRGSATTCSTATRSCAAPVRPSRPGR